MTKRRAKTTTIITAMRILQRDIRSDDGVASAAIGEAADRLEEMRYLMGEVAAYMEMEMLVPHFYYKRIKAATK